MLKNKSKEKKNIVSIIVTFKPFLSSLKKVLQKHHVNFGNLIIVNNSPEISLDSFKFSQVTIINNSDNIGLASALNVGILEAKKQGAQMVALFDQDTLLPDDFTQNMLNYINHYSGDKPTAVYSPVFHNHVINETGKHINFKPFRLIRDPVLNTEDYAHPHYVITSGSIIPMKEFAPTKIGFSLYEIYSSKPFRFRKIERITENKDLQTQFYESKNKYGFDWKNSIMKSDFVDTVNIENDGIKILASKNKRPFVEFKPITSKGISEPIFYIELESNQDQKMKIYYQTKHKQEFDKSQRIKQYITKGRNSIYIKIPETDFSGPLRIDFDKSKSTEVMIKNIEVRI